MFITGSMTDKPVFDFQLKFQRNVALDKQFCFLNKMICSFSHNIWMQGLLGNYV